MCAAFNPTCKLKFGSRKFYLLSFLLAFEAIRSTESCENYGRKHSDKIIVIEPHTKTSIKKNLSRKR